MSDLSWVGWLLAWLGVRCSLFLLDLSLLVCWFVVVFVFSFVRSFDSSIVRSCNRSSFISLRSLLRCGGVGVVAVALALQWVTLCTARSARNLPTCPSACLPARVGRTNNYCEGECTRQLAATPRRCCRSTEGVVAVAAVVVVVEDVGSTVAVSWADVARDWLGTDTRPTHPRGAVSGCGDHRPLASPTAAVCVLLLLVVVVCVCCLRLPLFFFCVGCRPRVFCLPAPRAPARPTVQ